MTRMDTSPLQLERHPSTPKKMQEHRRDTKRSAPRAQTPVNVVIPWALPSPHEDYVLKVIQQPEIAKVATAREKVRTPLDPPLVIELSFKTHESNRTYLCSPFFFGNIEIIPERLPLPSDRPQFQSALISGSLVSSLHKVRLDDNFGQLHGVEDAKKENNVKADLPADHAFFVFGDLNVKFPGSFRLKFNLFEMHKMDNGDFHGVPLGSVNTNFFKAFSPKDFPGQMESTPLSRQLSDQGIKLRIRKENSKRKAQCSDWAADYFPHPYDPMSSYPRERNASFSPGYGRAPRTEPRNVRPRYSNAAGPDRSLHTTLPIGFNLPVPTTSSRYAAPSIPAPTSVYHQEPNTQVATRASLNPMLMTSHCGTPGWSRISAPEDTIPFRERRDQNNYDDGNQSGLEHHQRLQTAGRYSHATLPHRELPRSVDYGGQYSHQASIISTHDHPMTPTLYNHHPGSFVSDTDRFRTSGPPSLLPPIDPGLCRNEPQLRSPPMDPSQQHIPSDAQAAYSTQIQSHDNGMVRGQEQKTPPPLPEPRI